MKGDEQGKPIVLSYLSVWEVWRKLLKILMFEELFWRAFILRFPGASTIHVIHNSKWSPDSHPTIFECQKIPPLKICFHSSFQLCTSSTPQWKIKHKKEKHYSIRKIFVKSIFLFFSTFSIHNFLFL